MKHKYSILEKHYEDGSVWFMPQIGDWWHGWRYICEHHPCPEDLQLCPEDLRRLAYKTFEEADVYMKDFIERDKQGTISLVESYSNYPVATKIHDCLVS